MNVLETVYQFSDVVAEEIYEVSEEIDLAMGEYIINFDSQLTHVYILITGRLRQLVQHPNDQNKVLTLAIYESSFVAGWASHQANLSLETISAAEDSKLLKLSHQSWDKITKKHPEIGLLFNQRVTPADLWPLIIRQQGLCLPGSTKELKKWINNLCQESNVYWIFPGTPKSFELSSNKYWIVAENGELEYGTLMTQIELSDIQAKISKPLRLISFPESSLAGTSSFRPKITKESNIPESVDSSSILESDQDSPPNDNLPKETQYRFFESVPGYIPEAISCFRTVGDQLKLPIKVDILKRIFEEQSSKTEGKVSLQLCAAISESLGLKTQLLNLPVNLIGRLKTPSLVHLRDDELCVALASKTGKLLLARPKFGIESLTIEDLTPLSDEASCLPVLILQKTDRTPQKKFDFKWFLPLIKKNKRPLLEVLIASFFVQIFQLMNPLIVQQIVDKVIGQNGMSTLPVLAVLLFSFSLFENVLTAVRTNLFIDTTNRIDISLGEQVIDHLLRLPLTYFDKRPVGELSSRLGELEQIRSFLTGTALTVIMDAVFSVVYIIIMLVYSWVLTIVALLVAPILALLTFSLSPVIRSQLRSKANLNANTQNHLIEILTGIQTVKAQNFELKARWKWKERYSDYVAEGFRNAVTSTTANGLTQFFNQISSLSVLCVGAYLVLKGELTLGQLIAFRIIAGYVTTPLLRLSGLYQSFQQTSISLERLADIIDTPQESTETDQKNIPLAEIQGNITYEELSFRFGKQGPLQLTQVDLDISAGEFAAIVGQSGSGKSTLTKLLTRLYEPNAGRILVDSMDIAKVELYSLRSQIGIVPQDSLLFEGSVQDNISLSNPEATSDEVIAAAKVACAHEFIMSLPSGYASSVGERGGALSGGQRQRIAIARTVLQNPRLLIMDEATSALDYQTERLVSLNLMEYFRGKTVLFITHRLNSIVHADKIVMMHQGQVDEVGTHEELLELKGRYFALFNQQGNT
ncbi:peptidase domain-containing ABC transporter [Synechococcus sp. MVIR-18-1]|uniref:peptidase domain-containing ABC transporter n=1 Tax=Synechococcus sp. MVIR-18-1 TaxID=1386941 RepID=UPI001647A942|nr:peptidase domain-containing ABC transporter [Synechococcus sp. MVIR-18-1]QNI75797.1 ABC multidrug efflux transporter [Synechococcus sp. MVIR-18-1]